MRLFYFHGGIMDLFLHCIVRYLYWLIEFDTDELSVWSGRRFSRQCRTCWRSWSALTTPWVSPRTGWRPAGPAHRGFSLSSNDVESRNRRRTPQADHTARL